MYVCMCFTALTVNDCRVCLDDRKCVNAVAADLSWAFDSVFNNLLYRSINSKLSGSPKHPLALMKAYLHDWCQRVKFNWTATWPLLHSTLLSF